MLSKLAIIGLQIPLLLASGWGDDDDGWSDEDPEMMAMFYSKEPEAKLPKIIIGKEWEDCLVQTVGMTRPLADMICSFLYSPELHKARKLSGTPFGSRLASCRAFEIDIVDGFKDEDITELKSDGKFNVERIDFKPDTRRYHDEMLKLFQAGMASIKGIYENTGSDKFRNVDHDEAAISTSTCLMPKEYDVDYGLTRKTLDFAELKKVRGMPRPIHKLCDYIPIMEERGDSAWHSWQFAIFKFRQQGKLVFELQIQMDKLFEAAQKKGDKTNSVEVPAVLILNNFRRECSRNRPYLGYPGKPVAVETQIGIKILDQGTPETDDIQVSQDSPTINDADI